MQRNLIGSFARHLDASVIVIVPCGISHTTGRITYMSLRRKVGPETYLWIVLAYEHVITAWVTRKPGTRATHPLIVKDGPAWDAAAEDREPRTPQDAVEQTPEQRP